MACRGAASLPDESGGSATAAAQRAGETGVVHVAEICRFFNQLPGWVDEVTRERAERHLAKLATEVRPDELRVAAERMADCLNPTGSSPSGTAHASAAFWSAAKTSTA